MYVRIRHICVQTHFEQQQTCSTFIQLLCKNNNRIKWTWANYVHSIKLIRCEVILIVWLNRYIWYLLLKAKILCASYIYDANRINIMPWGRQTKNGHSKLTRQSVSKQSKAQCARWANLKGWRPNAETSHLNANQHQNVLLQQKQPGQKNLPKKKNKQICV